ncbi:tRNA (adenosine(37)-N6)-threonylcarbamoyltransferase complex ATPase subunit type 1 TsaE [Clostridia bacterium]|nr:tRNA (adenosine(37)-N6)-threonylcarbamoyltransferase complex ATPase subunit type 1 TsaE [Clostridia bacterium]
MTSRVSYSIIRNMNIRNMNTQIKNREQAWEFGHRLAEKAEPGTVIALIGDLGTGKTMLTKAIAEGLGIRDEITSPTFTILHEYTGGRLPLYHFDVYRLASSDDMYDLGYEEYFYGKGVTVVEWADIIINLLPEDAIFVKIEYNNKGIEDERVYSYNVDISD